MERLTMYEVIEHCKRKVQKVEAMFRKEHLESDNCGVADLIQKEYWEHRQVAEWLEELKQYRTAEEQGLLLRLPCKIGSTLYQYQRINGQIIEREYKVIGLFFDISREKWLYEIAYQIGVEWRRTMCSFDAIGLTAFPTREEAKQAMKQMGE